MEQKIIDHCLNLIARQQPLANDLRQISTALEIITDMKELLIIHLILQKLS